MFARNYHHGDRWLPGVIQKKTGPVSFLVKLNDGRMRRCHQDQLRKHTVELSQELQTESNDTVPPVVIRESPSATASESSTAAEVTPAEQSSARGTVVEDSTNGTEKTYHKHSRQPLVRYEPTW